MRKRPWMPLKDAAYLLGVELKTVQNSLSAGTFRLPTYKLGKRRVVDRLVVARFFQLRRREGLATIEKYTRRR